MPEALVIAHIEREIRTPPPLVASRAKGYEQTGIFVIHPECCAQVDGNRPTTTLHQCGPDDTLFLPLVSSIEKTTTCPQSRSYTSSSSHGNQDPIFDAESIRAKISHLAGAPAADIVNTLGIQGGLLSVVRGKELVLAIGQFIIRTCFALEGHGLWVPTSLYKEIIARGVVPRGAKSSTFTIPANYWDGCLSVPGQISIQAAYVCPEWTWIFVDHNVMLTFYIMALRRVCVKDDLKPGTNLWNSLWSATHGPSLILERPLAEVGLDRWRLSKIKDCDYTPIFLTVKSNQTVFNGYGAQETCDMLFRAMLSPCMPTWVVCKDRKTWARFMTTIFEYQDTRLELVNSKPSILPYVSGRRPFRFNKDGHNRFLAHVSTYRRQFVQVHKDDLSKINELNLLNPCATLQNDGCVTVESTENENASIMVEVREGCEHIRLPNYQFSIPLGKNSRKIVRVYSPFRAKLHPSWQWPIEKFEICNKDVKDDCNLTTLGPYSFQVFVLSAWTMTKVKGKNLKEAGLNRQALQGRRKELDVGVGKRKRSTVAEIEKSSQKAKRAKKENISNTVISEGRTLRSGKKLL